MIYCRCEGATDIQEKIKDTTPVYSIHIRVLLPQISLVGRYLMGSEMKFWEFSQFREARLAVYSFSSHSPL
jgi:hypothetical protein